MAYSCEKDNEPSGSMKCQCTRRRSPMFGTPVSKSAHRPAVPAEVFRVIRQFLQENIGIIPYGPPPPINYSFVVLSLDASH